MTTDNFNPKKALQLTKIIYFSLITGSLAYMVLVFYIAADKLIFKPDLTDPLLLSLLILCCTTIPFGYLYSKKTCNKIDPNDLLRKKYSIYQTGLIIKLATCEGVALIAVGFLLFTNNLFSAIFFLIALIVMIVYFPTPDKIGKEINLTQSEIELFH
jgi:hypothetical protein